MSSLEGALHSIQQQTKASAGPKRKLIAEISLSREMIGGGAGGAQQLMGATTRPGQQSIDLSLNLEDIKNLLRKI